MIAISEKHDVFEIHDADDWRDEEEICTTA
jgi:hypothetical protein